MTVERRLAGAPGVASAHVNYATGTATIATDGSGPPVSDLVKVVRETGFDCSKATAALPLEGLDYAVGVVKIERLVRNLPGVIDASANTATGLLTVEYLPGMASPRDFEIAAAEAGVLLAEPVPVEDVEERDRAARARTLRIGGAKCAAAIVAFVAAMILTMPLMGAMRGNDLLGTVLQLMDPAVRSVLPGLYAVDSLVLYGALIVITLGVLAWPGREFLTAAWRTTRRSAADVNTLIAASVAAVFVYSVAAAVIAIAVHPGRPGVEVYFDAAIGMVAVILVGRLVESRAASHTLAAIRSVRARLPRTAAVERDGAPKQVEIEQVRLGERVVVNDGAVVPVDGVVLSGESEMDESVVTGNPRPVTKSQGDHVVAGAANGSGTLVVEATGVGRDRVLSQIERMLDRAQTSQPSFRSRADHVARGMVPVVIAFGFISFTLWYLLGPYPSAVFGMLAFATVLIAAGASAVALAIPTATLAGTGRAAQLGVLILGGRVLERMNRVDTLVFDKTGTITEGRPAVSHVLGAKRTDGTTVSPVEILRLAATVESQSRHPLARAIIAHARERNVEIGTVERFRGMSGRGVRGIVGRFLVEVISIRHAHERGLELGSLERSAEVHVLAGRTPVVVVVNDTVQGLIVAADQMRPEAKTAVARLRAMGYEVFLLSGDSKAATALAGREIGIERVIANVDPSDRADEIKRLQEDGRRVAMVGHGINDAPALSQADVGIALGVGTRLAIEASDVSLIRSDLGAVVTAMELARRTMRTMRGNLSLAYAYNALAIPIAAGILYPVIGLVLSPVLGAAAMATSSVAVVANSLRLNRYHPSTATTS